MQTRFHHWDDPMVGFWWYMTVESVQKKLTNQMCLHLGIKLKTPSPRLIWPWVIYHYKSLRVERSRVVIVRTWSYTIAESVFQRGAHCIVQFRSNVICEIWLDVCFFSVFWKTPPEKVEDRSQVFGLVSKTFFLGITLLDEVMSLLDEMSSNLNGMLRKAVRACTYH
jgi:hypothetical protein